ncbi:MAG: cytidine deaminase [Flavobacteriaceae bacterium]|nr:cytidine deaminase [Flavobacteriaceae bacterium]|tara:strand:- start:111220 stop:111702 length:483 start_codon:yes stop_codon:yes gene_type:complete
MKKIDVSTKAVQFESVADLSAQEQDLFSKAIEAQHNAYAPYSNFHVGTSVLLEDGTVITGNNQENAAYPSGMCAERVAIWKVGSSHPNKKILAIAIVAGSESKPVNRPVGPCGACRQTLLEYEINQKENIELLFKGDTGPIIKVASINDLLPFNFDSSYL